MFCDTFFLTREVLEGRKTMTRRIESGVFIHNATKEGVDYMMKMHKSFNSEKTVIQMDGVARIEIHTRYNVGDIVAVAQCYNDLFECGYSSEELDTYVGSCHPGVRNKMFIKPELMPNRIRITDVKVERLQDISDEDCMKEGIRHIKDMMFYYFEDNKDNGYYHNTPREAFASLINKVSGEGIWEKNPWVVAYEFELVDHEEKNKQA